MRKLIMAVTIAGFSAAPAFAQGPSVFHPDTGAQNTTLTIETLTKADCDIGYKSDMKFSKAEFDQRCKALQSAK